MAMFGRIVRFLVLGVLRPLVCVFVIFCRLIGVFLLRYYCVSVRFSVGTCEMGYLRLNVLYEYLMYVGSYLSYELSVCAV